MSFGTLSARTIQEEQIMVWALVFIIVLIIGLLALSIVLWLDRRRDCRRRAAGEDIDVGHQGQRWLQWHAQRSFTKVDSIDKFKPHSKIHERNVYETVPEKPRLTHAYGTM